MITTTPLTSLTTLAPSATMTPQPVPQATAPTCDGYQPALTPDPSMAQQTALRQLASRTSPTTGTASSYTQLAQISTTMHQLQMSTLQRLQR